MSTYFEAIFEHKQEIITIQVDSKEIWKNIIQKYQNKTGIDIKTIYFLYSGNIINEEKRVEQMINSEDAI